MPKSLVSDNGTVFTSKEFTEFTKNNAISHVTSAPYHPATNGLAERAVQTFKRTMRKQGDGTLETRLSRFLFSYRITPHATTGETPAKLLMGRELRSHLSNLHPALTDRVRTAQQRQKDKHDKSAKARELAVGDAVYARSYTDAKWVPGTIQSRTGPISSTVRLEPGKGVIRRHDDQLRPRTLPITDTAESADSQADSITPITETPSLAAHTQNNNNADVNTDTLVPVPGNSSTPARRYPARARKVPDRFMYN